METVRHSVCTALLTVLASSLLSCVVTVASFAQSSSVLTQLDKDFAKIAAKVTPAVVTITRVEKKTRPPERTDWFGLFSRKLDAPQPPGPRVRSGVIVSPDGMILTKVDRIKDGGDVRVTLEDKRSFKAELIGADEGSGLEVIKIKAENLPTAVLGDSDQVRTGEIVFAVGTHFGFNNLVTIGIVSGTGRSNVGIRDYENFIVTDARVSLGGGGGVLVNLREEVVGINLAIVRPPDLPYGSLALSVPSNLAKTVMEDLIKHGKVRRGQLGVNIQDLNQSHAKSLGLPNTQGVLVVQVIEGSPAETAGIKAGDTIITFNDRTVLSATDLALKAAMEKPGTFAKLIVFRNGETLNVEVALGERPEKSNWPEGHPGEWKSWAQ